LCVKSDALDDEKTEEFPLVKGLSYGSNRSLWRRPGGPGLEMQRGPKGRRQMEN